MRIRTISLLVALLFASAALTGCMGKNKGADADGGDDGGDDGTGGGSGTGGDGGSGTGGDGGSGTGGNGTGDDGNGTAPPPPPPPADVNETVSLSVPTGISVVPGTPVEQTGSATFTVAETGWATFQIAFTPTSFQADGVTIVVTDAEGNEVARAAFAAPTPPESVPAPQTVDVTASLAGEFTITGTANTAGGAAFDCQVMVTY